MATLTVHKENSCSATIVTVSMAMTHNIFNAETVQGSKLYVFGIQSHMTCSGKV
jgi:hypothetical protein